MYLLVLESAFTMVGLKQAIFIEENTFGFD